APNAAAQRQFLESSRLDAKETPELYQYAAYLQMVEGIRLEEVLRERRTLEARLTAALTRSRGEALLMDTDQKNPGPRGPCGIASDAGGV
ncbi:MAG: hypothetical protein HQL11_05520, partial [Candidatus Omnitrophica bacterium]|nr:hypothetical protein [Candidatus Omnitrophota bacterium]